jgi:hypothetical protein
MNLLAAEQIEIDSRKKRDRLKTAFGGLKLLNQKQIKDLSIMNLYILIYHEG